MRQYDVYKSEGGYRVACDTYLDCPVTDSSPWFKTKSEAEAYRDKRIKERIAYIENDVYPPSLQEREIAALRKLLKKQTYYILSGEGERGTWSIVETCDIKRILRKERCGGDRWAKAYGKSDCHYTEDGFRVVGVNVETGYAGFITGDAAEDFRRASKREE